MENNKHRSCYWNNLGVNIALGQKQNTKKKRFEQYWESWCVQEQSSKLIISSILIHIILVANKTEWKIPSAPEFICWISEKWQLLNKGTLMIGRTYDISNVEIFQSIYTKYLYQIHNFEDLKYKGCHKNLSSVFFFSFCDVHFLVQEVKIEL